MARRETIDHPQVTRAIEDECTVCHMPIPRYESGALNADGSIQGNDNDADKARYEPHYREITSAEQIEIFEPILQDSEGKVTTGLLAVIGYLTDNRILPTGFDKATAGKILP